jgi:hypothetical protein
MYSPIEHAMALGEVDVDEISPDPVWWTVKEWRVRMQWAMVSVLRHGGVAALFGGVYAPSRRGWFLRLFASLVAVGHREQLS